MSAERRIRLDTHATVAVAMGLFDAGVPLSPTPPPTDPNRVYFPRFEEQVATVPECRTNPAMGVMARTLLAVSSSATWRPTLAVCARRTVRQECLALGLAEGDRQYGVWGGTTPAERRQLLEQLARAS